MGEDNSGFELTRRRVLGSVVATGAAAAGVGAGTWAAFSDTESSTGNSVKAGTLDLTTSNSGDFKFTITGKAPGDGDGATSLDGIAVTLSHEGTVPADHIEIDIDNRPKEDADGDLSSSDSGPESDTSTATPDGMAEYIVVEELSYKNTDGTKTTYVSGGSATTPGSNRGISDQNENSRIDLDDLDQLSEPGSNALDDFDAPTTSANGGATTDLNLNVSLAEDMPNEFQGDVLLVDLFVTLHQNSTQDYDADTE